MIIQQSIAKRQEDILEEQKSIAQNTAQDGSQMKIMAFLTAVFLPATFMAVCPAFRHLQPLTDMFLGVFDDTDV
jgi:hypothetical protein